MTKQTKRLVAGIGAVILAAMMIAPTISMIMEAGNGAPSADTKNPPSSLAQAGNEA